MGRALGNGFQANGTAGQRMEVAPSLLEGPENVISQVKCEDMRQDLLSPGQGLLVLPQGQ